jgi:hypothetical protein
MNNEPAKLDTLLQLAQITRAKREQYEDALAECRRESKSLALQLIFDYAFSLNRVSAITGHMRPTLKVWVESEAARRGIPAFKPIRDL